MVITDYLALQFARLTSTIRTILVTRKYGNASYVDTGNSKLPGEMSTLALTFSSNCLDCARVVRSIRLISFRPPLILCSLLDTLSLVFSMYMVYCLFLQILGDAPAGREVVWCVNLVSACNRRNLMLFVI